MIKFNNNNGSAIHGNYIAVKLAVPMDDGHTYQTLVHNGVEWLRHGLHKDQTAAFAYIADHYSIVVNERRTPKQGEPK